MSLIDSMAAALRQAISEYDELVESEFDSLTASGKERVATMKSQIGSAREVLAQYDALRAAPVVKPVLRAGQRVRVKHGLSSWQGVVLYTKAGTVAVQTDDGGEFIAMIDEVEVIPNLPATNTGD